VSLSWINVVLWTANSALYLTFAVIQGGRWRWVGGFVCVAMAIVSLVWALS